MIPEFNPDDYEKSDDFPEELLSIILLAIPKYEKSRIDNLIAGASKNYIAGNKIAYERIGKKFVSSEIKDDVYAFLKEYKKQIEAGYTVIQGEKVYWLRDRTLVERQKIFDIVSEGITKGKSPDIVKKEFQDYFKMQKRQAERIARTETAYVQANGRDDRYKKAGVKKVKWLLGPKPCERCKPLGGQIFTWDELPYQQPAHVLCTCDLSPVLD